MADNETSASSCGLRAPKASHIAKTLTPSVVIQDTYPNTESHHRLHDETGSTSGAQQSSLREIRENN